MFGVHSLLVVRPQFLDPEGGDPTLANLTSHGSLAKAGIAFLLCLILSPTAR